MHLTADSTDRWSREAGSQFSRSRALLLCGALAGPIYVVLGLSQALSRPGFDLARHDLSLLSNGSLGWIQIGNFVLTGLLTVIGATGIHRALAGGGGRTWGSPLIGVYGAGLIGAGIFVADPALGFPPGTPANAGAISWHGALHLMCAAIGFLALIGAMLILARRFFVLGEGGWSSYSAATGVVFLLSFLGVIVGRPLAVAAGVSTSITVFGLWIGVLLAWTWLSVMAVRLMPGGTTDGPSSPGRRDPSVVKVTPRKELAS